MRFGLFLVAAILILAGWCVRLPSRREILIRPLFTLAAVSYFACHFTDSRTT